MKPVEEYVSDIKKINELMSKLTEEERQDVVQSARALCVSENVKFINDWVDNHDTNNSVEALIMHVAVEFIKESNKFIIYKILEANRNPEVDGITTIGASQEIIRVLRNISLSIQVCIDNPPKNN